MASIIERVKNLDLPLDHVVVIGSGLLDAYGLRSSSDVDLAVSDELYETLKAEGDLNEREKFGERMLEGDDLEVWHGWMEYSFDDLARNAIQIDGVFFVHQDTLLKFKRARSLEKDLKDIALLEEYIHERQ